ncbi:hypothetical protein SAMN04489731_10179 [Amycolatopsis regifaucium]|nr:hypothetical protein SAMN04489731_10179 [Amycolatopsis regifaucium]
MSLVAIVARSDALINGRSGTLNVPDPPLIELVSLKEAFTAPARRCSGALRVAGGEGVEVESDRGALEVE